MCIRDRGSANKDDWNWTGCGSTVYCVGLGLKASEGKDSEGCKINEYMYRVSSHRPDGSHVDNNRVNEWELGTDSWTGLYTDARTRNHENGYYLTTDNAAELQRIFTQIAQQTGEAVKDVTIRDEISESFVPCDAAGNAYTVGDTITSNGKTGTVRQDANGNYYICLLYTSSLAPISMSNASLSAATSDTMSNDSRMWSSMRAVSVSKSTSGRRSVRMSISSCSCLLYTSRRQHGEVLEDL